MDLRLINGGSAAGRVGVCDGVFGDLTCSDLQYLTLDGGTVDAEYVNAIQVSSTDYVVADTVPAFSIPRSILSNYSPRYTVELSAAQPSILFANGAGANVGAHLEKVLGAFVPGQMIEYLFEGSVVSNGTNNFDVGPWFDTTPPTNGDSITESVSMVATTTPQSFSFRFLITVVSVTPTLIDYNVSTMTTISGVSSTTTTASGEEVGVAYDTVNSTVFTTLAVGVGALIGSDTITLTVVTTLTRLLSGSYGYTPP